MDYNKKIELNLFEYFSDVYYWNRDSDKFLRINQKQYQDNSVF
jgi:hypothetical protein